MNIVNISAGLGNQIFQYAFYRALRAKDADTKMDISDFNYRNHHNGYELESIFNICPDYATRKECDALADLSKSLLSDIRRKIFRIHLKCQGQVLSEAAIGCQYHAQLFNNKNSYFVGFWQTEKYFKSIEQQLREELVFKNALDNENQKIAHLIADCNAVSLHVRRGDYVKARRVDTFGSVCSLDYYNKAVEHIQSRIDNPRFFVFSDDMLWVKENIKLNNAVYVDINRGKNSFKDMHLMSLCKHNIIANSSFSWWGAWLNANESKIVVAPSVWVRCHEMPDVVPDSWLQIKVD